MNFLFDSDTLVKVCGAGGGVGWPNNAYNIIERWYRGGIKGIPKRRWRDNVTIATGLGYFKNEIDMGV